MCVFIICLGTPVPPSATPDGDQYSTPSTPGEAFPAASQSDDPYNRAPPSAAPHRPPAMSPQPDTVATQSAVFKAPQPPLQHTYTPSVTAAPDPYAQPPGTPRPAPFTRPQHPFATAGKPRPPAATAVADPYARPPGTPGTPRTPSQEAFNPRFPTPPPRVTADPFAPRPVGAASTEPTAYDPYSRPPGTPRVPAPNAAPATVGGPAQQTTQPPTTPATTGTGQELSSAEIQQVMAAAAAAAAAQGGGSGTQRFMEGQGMVSNLPILLSNMQAFFLWV